MDITITEKLNTLPVTTFRWLNLNELSIDKTLSLSAKAYKKDFLSGMNEKDFILARMSDAPINGSLSVESKLKDYGVSKELVSFSEANFNSGAYLKIGQGVTVDSPVLINYELDSKNDVVIDNNLIIAEKGSKVTIIMDISSSENAFALHSGVTRIIAKDGAEVTLVKVQRMSDQSFHFDSNLAVIEGAAKVRYIEVEFGSKKAVTNYRNELGESAEAYLDAIYLGDKDRHLDLSYIMEHLGRRSKSGIEVRGVLKDKASKVFRGTIDFKRGSSLSEGSEQEDVILFDRAVKSDSIPLLLCAEDDVKGQHAASAGKVDKEKLFYLMSRGFSKEEAENLLVEASFSSIIDKIPVEDLRKIVSGEIRRRLLNEL